MKISDTLLTQAAWADYLLSERERIKKCYAEKLRDNKPCQSCELRIYVDRAYNVILNNTLSK